MKGSTMKREEVADRVKGIISTQLGLSKEEFGEDSGFLTDLNADSLDGVELTMGIEDEFDINIKDTEVDELFNVKQMIDFVYKRINEKDE
jgi:acyl carrier protein